MIASQDALRRVGWAALLAVACALLFGMSLVVNAVRSDVRRTELKILSLKREMLYLDTEFETRANQQQLEAWNDVDFGYVAPTASQYLADRRALALLGKPVATPAAPSPVLLAAAETSAAVTAAPAAATPAQAPRLAAADMARPSAREALRPADTASLEEQALPAATATKLADKERQPKPARAAKLASAKPATAATPAKDKPARDAKLAKAKPAPAAPAKEKPAPAATPTKVKPSTVTRLAKAERKAADRTRLAAAEITP
jgi:hypothetical protein